MERIKAIYRVESDAASIESRAEAIAFEQSVEVPRAAIFSDWVLDNILARVENIEPMAGGAFKVTIALAAETTAFEPGQLVSMLYGNISLADDVRILDAEFPPELVASFAGPRFGIEGIREACKAFGRPLTCSALKPQGLDNDSLAKLAYTFALAGVDMIKDDHGIMDQSYSRFAERVPKVQAAVNRANRETGGSTLYAPSLYGGPSKLIDCCRIVREEGVGAAMLIPMVAGLPTFHEITGGHLQVPVLAHPGFGGAQRMAPKLLFGKLFRLFGADATIFVNHHGRFTWPREICEEVGRTMREPMGGLKPSLPVPAGGMTLDRVADMRAGYGEDAMFLIGGGLLTAGDKLLDRCREFVAMVARKEEVPQ
jgi:ribulose-bisphosphate carboxylase large chain